MTSKILFLFAGCLTASLAQMDIDLSGLIEKGEKFNFTDNIQHILPQMNQFVESKNMATVSLPDIACRKTKTAILSGVSFEGLDKMTTAVQGVATVLAATSVKICTTIVWENTKLVAEKYSEANADLTWDIGSLTMDVHLYMLYSKADNCFTKYSKLKIVDMSNIVQHSSNATIEGTAPLAQNVQKLMKFYNHYLKNPKVMDALSKSLNICEPPKSEIANAISTSIPTSQ